MTDNAQDIYGASRTSLLEADDDVENTSGMGKAYPVPEGVSGWSWGAFLFNWLWALGNKTWIGLLALIPYVGFIMAIVLGVKGREWAWQNKKWQSVEHFNRVQRRWSIWAACLLVIPIIGILAAIAIPAYQDYTVKAHMVGVMNIANDAAKAVGNYVQTNHALPGSIQEAGMTSSLPADVQSILIDQATGRLRITMNVQPIMGKAFFLAPSLDGGAIAWRCLSGEIRKNLLPQQCHFDTAEEFHIPQGN